MTNMFVNIKNGKHRGNDITGVFPLVKAHQGKFVTVKTNGKPPFAVIDARINVDVNDIEYCGSEGQEVNLALVSTMPGAAGEVATNYELEFLSRETESEAMDRIHDTFESLNEITEAARKGIMRGVIISGPPGIGKSYGVERTLEQGDVIAKLEGSKTSYEIIKGNASAIGIYKTLYDNRKANSVTVFDDCDEVLFDQTSLNMLKAALDSSTKRVLHWRTESRVLEDSGIPRSFEFNGSVIFLTNINFDATRNSKIAMHLSALKSRCHYLDLGISNQRDQLLRIKQIVRDGMLNCYNFVENEEDIIVDYIKENADYMQELSLRMVSKIADIVKMKGIDNWVPMAETTCLKREARYKRLYTEQAETHENLLLGVDKSA